MILDAKYDRHTLREAIIAEAQSHHIPLQIIHCHAPIEVLRDRLQQRTGDIADATVDLLPQQSLDAFTEMEQPYVKSVDTTQNLESQIEKLGI